MTTWFKRRPVALFFLIIIILGFVSALNEPDGDMTMAILLGIAGLMGFVNSIWLNERINRLHDALEDKGMLTGADLIVDDRLRNLINKNK